MASGRRAEHLSRQRAPSSLWPAPKFAGPGSLVASSSACRLAGQCSRAADADPKFARRTRRPPCVAIGASSKVRSRCAIEKGSLPTLSARRPLRFCSPTQDSQLTRNPKQSSPQSPLFARPGAGQRRRPMAFAGLVRKTKQFAQLPFDWHNSHGAPASRFGSLRSHSRPPDREQVVATRLHPNESAQCKPHESPHRHPVARVNCLAKTARHERYQKFVPPPRAYSIMHRRKLTSLWKFRLPLSSSDDEPMTRP